MRLPPYAYQQIAGRGVPGTCFPDMLRGPLRSGMSGHGKVENPAAGRGPAPERHKAPGSDRRHRKEVDRHHRLEVMFKVGPPPLRWRFAGADYVSAHARFADGNANLSSSP